MRMLLRVLVATTLLAAGLLFPTRWAWSLPEVRYGEVAVAAAPAVTALTPPAGRGGAALPHPSSHLGVRWKGDHEDHLQLRWRSGTGPWSGWTDVVVDHDLGDEDAAVILSGLLSADDATAVEVRVLAGAPSGIRVAAIDTVHGPRRLEPVRSPAGAAFDADARVPQPDVISRAEWGADETIGDKKRSFAGITRMSVHHTVTDNSADPVDTIRAIQRWHVLGNGWSDIGYNFVIDRNGRVYEGRWARDYAGAEPTGEDTSGRGVTGAHTGGNNTGTVGVAILGTYTEVAPTSQSVSALEQLLAWKADRHDVDPTGTTTWTRSGSTITDSTIIGHRDAVSTSCPGQRLYDLLPQVRQRVKGIVDAAHSPSVIGYWVLGRDATRHTFGAAINPLLTGVPPMAPAHSIARTPSGRGYWVLSGSGRVSTFGDATFHGSTELDGLRLNAPPVRLEPTPTGRGYWILGADGGVFSYGDAAFHGSTGNMRLNAPVLSMAATPTGGGYWLLAKDGGVFSFGDAAFHGSTGSMRLNAPVVSMAPHPKGTGYWLQAEDGGIFSFGQVAFHGSVPGLGIQAGDITQIRATPQGKGYYVLAEEGGIFAFGDARHHGATPGLSGASIAVDLALVPAEDK